MLKRFSAGKAVSAQLLLQLVRILQQFFFMGLFLADGADAYAVWVSLLAASGLFMFWDLGHQASVNFRLIKLISASRHKSAAFWITGCMWVHRRMAMFALLMTLLGFLWPSWLKEPLHLSEAEVRAGVALGASFMLTPFQNFLGAMYAALGQSHRGILLVVYQVAIQTVLLLGSVLYYPGHKLVLAAFSMLVGMLVSVAIGVYELRERLWELPSRRPRRWLRAIRPMNKSAMAYFLNPFLVQLVTFLQIKIIESFFGKGDVLAAFGMCRTIAGMPRQFASQFAAAQTAANIRSLFTDPQRFNRFVQRLGLSTSLGLGLVLGFVPLMSEVAAATFPEKVPSSTREVIGVFCWAYALGSAYVVAQVVIPAVGRPHIQTSSSVCSLALLVLLLAWPATQPVAMWVVSACLAAEVLAGWFAAGALYRQLKLAHAFQCIAEGVLLAMAALWLAQWFANTALAPLVILLKASMLSLFKS